MLTPGQRQRLHQIDLQVQGPRAFEDPDVMKALDLTAAQKARIHSITADAFFGGPCDPGPGKLPEARDNPASAAVARIEALLTKTQARKWKELTGAPFHGQVRMHFGPPAPFGLHPPRPPRPGVGPPDQEPPEPPPDHDG